MGTEAAAIERPEIKERPIQPEASFSLIDAISGQFLGSKNSDTRFRAEALHWKQVREFGELHSRYPGMRFPSRADESHAAKGVETAPEMVASFKRELYGKLGIAENKDSANGLGKFKLGLADGLVGDNIETVEALLEIGIDKVAETLLSIFSSLEKVKEFLLAVGKELLKNFQNLASFEPYETGKAIGALGFGAIGSLAKATGKEGVRHAIRNSTTERVNNGIAAVADARRGTEQAEGYVKWGFDKPHTPKDYLAFFKNLNKNFNVNELASNPTQTIEFSRSMENLSEFIQRERVRMSKEQIDDFYDEIMELRKNMTPLVSQLEKQANLTGGGRAVLIPLRIALTNVETAASRLKPNLWQPIEQ